MATAEFILPNLCSLGVYSQDYLNPWPNQILALHCKATAAFSVRNIQRELTHGSQVNPQTLLICFISVVLSIPWTEVSGFTVQIFLTVKDSSVAIAFNQQHPPFLNSIASYRVSIS